MLHSKPNSALLTTTRLCLSLQGYVSCAWGVENVGFVIVTYGVIDAICSFGLSFVIRRTGRVPIFVFGAIVNLVVVIALFQWHPDPNQTYVFFILAGLWGVSDSIWQTQINGIFLEDSKVCPALKT